MVTFPPGKQSPQDGIHHVLWNSKEASVTTAKGARRRVEGDLSRSHISCWNHHDFFAIWECFHVKWLLSPLHRWRNQVLLKWHASSTNDRAMVRIQHFWPPKPRPYTFHLAASPMCLPRAAGICALPTTVPSVRGYFKSYTKEKTLGTPHPSLFPTKQLNSCCIATGHTRF